MAEGFKDYIGECLREAPGAFRRGVIVVTILANLMLALGLYLGWHLNAFTALQISSAAVCIAMLEIILILPYRLWKANKAEIAELKLPGAPFPDWKIRKLFHHIRPRDLLENDNFEIVGAEVLDKLATGQLMAWGRKMNGIGYRPLQAIKMTFWYNARFTYFFLTKDPDSATHVLGNDLLENASFSDIHVNRVSALRIWPK
jgi:hypothetical protein